MNIFEQLTTIQTQLKAPKDLKNNFGGFKYRSAENILENLKPLLLSTKTTLTLSDEIVCIGSRYYFKATATLSNTDGQKIETTAYAREDEEFKGMSLGQLSGATSSYARKYALCGLFAIDNGDDLDKLDTTNVKTTTTSVREILMQEVKKLNINLDNASKYIGKSTITLTDDDLQKIVDMKKGNLKK